MGASLSSSQGEMCKYQTFTPPVYSCKLPGIILDAAASIEECQEELQRQQDIEKIMNVAGIIAPANKFILWE